MKHKYYLTSIIILSVAIIGIIIYVAKLPNHKVAYVRSTELVYGFKGMEEAHQKFLKNSSQLQANVDTLKSDYTKSVNIYKQNLSTYSLEERLSQEQIIKKQEENLRTYASSVEKQLQQEDQKITDAVLKQVNSFIEQYGQEKGYDMILGTTNSGSLLYAKDKLDITEEVLDALNNYYMGREGI